MKKILALLFALYFCIIVPAGEICPIGTFPSGMCTIDGQVYIICCTADEE